MNPAVRFRLELSETEASLLVEMLEHKEVELSHEIHHTKTLAMRQELEQLLDTVEGLLRKLKPA